MMSMKEFGISRNKTVVHVSSESLTRVLAERELILLDSQQLMEHALGIAIGMANLVQDAILKPAKYFSPIFHSENSC